jgi:glycolate oxidase FAD binding subunit
MSLRPETVEELQALVRENKALVLRGAGTKGALSKAPAGTLSLDMGAFNGISEYEPGEFTFTAYAGTPLSTIVEALAEHQQYLPFDPLLVQNGATLGGTVAANSSGSGRWRYGGIRDFILGIRFVDGSGRFVRSGGKVVKNAAGFDLPKFFVGSLGHYGALVEMSFKVFPQPQQYQTLQLRYSTIEELLRAIFALILSPLETDAIDIECHQSNYVLLIRVGGLETSLQRRLERLKDFLVKCSSPESIESIENDSQMWQHINNLEWMQGYESLVKVPMTPRQLTAFDTELQARIPSSKRRYSAGGNVAWIALNEASVLSSILDNHAFRFVGVQLIGTAASAILGNLKGQEILQRVKKVLDPNNVFRGMNNAAQD